MSRYKVVYTYKKPMQYSNSSGKNSVLEVQITEDSLFKEESPKLFRFHHEESRYTILIDLKRKYAGDRVNHELSEHRRFYRSNHFPSAEEIKRYVEQTVENFLRTEEEKVERHKKLAELDEALDNWNPEF